MQLIEGNLKIFSSFLRKVDVLRENSHIPEEKYENWVKFLKEKAGRKYSWFFFLLIIKKTKVVPKYVLNSYISIESLHAINYSKTVTVGLSPKARIKQQVLTYLRPNQ